MVKTSLRHVKVGCFSPSSTSSPLWVKAREQWGFEGGIKCSVDSDASFTQPYLSQSSHHILPMPPHPMSSPTERDTPPMIAGDASPASSSDEEAFLTGYGEISVDNAFFLPSAPSGIPSRTGSLRDPTYKIWSEFDELENSRREAKSKSRHPMKRPPLPRQSSTSTKPKVRRMSFSKIFRY